ncbi:MAG: sugar transporter [Prevotella sp.]|nr:sugar transporter [Prevotella sp.]
MTKESRTYKSLLNAKVNLAFYFLSFIVSFLSRKIFLDHLGADFIGLTGTLQNILGFLNLAELGVGASVSYALYKPIAKGNKEEICRIVSVFGCLYRYIGGFVLAAGIVVCVFFPLIFRHTIFEMGIIYFAFFSFLTSSLIGYFVNYRSILLSADQRNYVVIACFQTAMLVKLLVQMALVYHTGNLYLWVAIELVYGIIYASILNWKISKTYPWLSSSIALGTQLRRQYPDIVHKTKQVFVHKMKDFLLRQSDQILIFAFVSLKMVAYYGNYTMVIGRITLLFTIMMGGIVAGVGNLVADGDDKKIYRVFWEMAFVHYTIAGIVAFAVYTGIQPLISLWLGGEYLLSRTIVILLLVNTFIMLSRGAVDTFNAAYGNYQDTWSAWAEGTINIIVTIVTCSIWGLPGILIGKIASLIPIIVIWKPLFLYRTSFHRSIWHYWKNVTLMLLCFAIAFVMSSATSRLLPIEPYQGFLPWTAYCLISTSLFSVVYIAILYISTDGARSMVRRIIKR